MRKLSLGILVLAGLGAAQGNDTAMFGSDPGRTRGTDERVPPKAAPDPVLSLRWSAPVSLHAMSSSPIVAGGLLYVMSSDGVCSAMDPGDGSVQWQYATSGGATGTPAFHRGRLYVPGGDGNIHVLNAGTGALLYQVYTGTAIPASPLVAPGVDVNGTLTDLLLVALGAPGAEIRAYDATTGAAVWTGSAGFSQLSSSSPTYHAEFNRVIVGDNSGAWHCYDASTGAKLWKYKTPSKAYHTAAAVSGSYVAIPSGGGTERNVHILKQTATSPYYELHKNVGAMPPENSAGGLVNKVNGTANGEPNVTHPWTKVSREHLNILREMDAADRAEFLDTLSASNGANYDDLKEWLALDGGETDADLNKASTQTGVSYINLSWAVLSSSPAFVGDKILVAHRGMSGSNTDEFYMTAITVDADPALTQVTWGTMAQTFTLPGAEIVASPVISQSTYVYAIRGQELEVRNLSDGTKEGFLDLGVGVVSGPTLANGRVYLGTGDGDLLCFDSGNNPPATPTAMSPAGLSNELTNTPTLQWTAIDPDGGTLSARIWYGVGLSNPEMDLWQVTPIDLPAGASSYTLPWMADNSKISWRVEVADPDLAKAISPVETFWVNKDTIPPLPPAGMTTLPLDGGVQVDWQESPSGDVTGYRLSVKPASQAGWSGATVLDDLFGTSYTMTSLVNGTPYEFRLEAKDVGENYSTAIYATETPMAPVTVNGTQYATVQAALNAASPGDTVELGVATFVGDLSVPPGVSLNGYSPHQTKIFGTGTGTVIQVQGDVAAGQVRIGNLSVTYGTTGIAAGTADLLVENVVVYQVNGAGLTADFGGRLEAVNNTICHNIGRGIDALTDPAEANVRNNLVGENGGGIYTIAGSMIDYNQAWGNAPEENFAPGTVGTENNTETSLFKEIANGDYRVLEGSAGIDGADPADSFDLEPTPNGDRRNQGAYGNSVWAMTTAPGGIGTAPPAEGGGGGGGGCGALGLDFLLMLGLLRLGLRGIRRHSTT